MTSYIETKIVALTSQSATIKYNNNYLSNVKYNLGSIYNNDDNIIHKQVQLLNAQIPYSFYVINYTNNQFKYQLGTSTIFTSTIPVGNYNGNSLITALKAAALLNSITLIITLSSIDGKLTFTHATSNFTFYSLTYSILPTLGFESNTNYTSSSLSLTTPYALNLLGIKALQIRSSNLIMSNISSVQGGQTTLLSTIPVECQPFGMLNYVDKGNHLMTIYNDSLDDIDIDIIDGESSNYINFNNQDWCITLAFHITRSLEPIQKTTFWQGGNQRGNAPFEIPKPPEGTNGSPEGTNGSPKPPEGTNGSPKPPEGTNGSPKPPPSQSKDLEQMGNPPEGTNGSPKPPEGTNGSPKPPPSQSKDLEELNLLMKGFPQ